ncbi:hypothetical protein B0O80DRAFT_428434 [Mortierella sp. GBAus27b]|nr:hypothetical protein B0O80DRAFT_428434 [Mortierella sp. GBAus27b]
MNYHYHGRRAVVQNATLIGYASFPALHDGTAMANLIVYLFLNSTCVQITVNAIGFSFRPVEHCDIQKTRRSRGVLIKAVMKRPASHDFRLQNSANGATGLCWIQWVERRHRGRSDIGFVTLDGVFVACSNVSIRHVSQSSRLTFPFVVLVFCSRL